MSKIRTLSCLVDIKKRSFLPLVCFDPFYYVLVFGGGGGGEGGGIRNGF